MVINNNNNNNNNSSNKQQSTHNIQSSIPYNLRKKQPTTQLQHLSKPSSTPNHVSTTPRTTNNNNTPSLFTSSTTTYYSSSFSSSSTSSSICSSKSTTPAPSPSLDHHHLVIDPNNNNNNSHHKPSTTAMVKLCFEHEPSLSLDEKSILDATLVTTETTVIEAIKQPPQPLQHQPSKIPILTVPPPTRSNLITNNHQQHQSVSDSMVTTRSKIKRQHAFRGGDNNKVVNENLGVGGGGGEVGSQKSAFKSVMTSSSSQSKSVSKIETTKKVGSGGVGIGKSQKKIEVKVGDEDDREYDCDGDEDDSEVVLLVFNRNLPSQSSSAVEQAKVKRPTAVIDANQSQINKVGYLLIWFRQIFRGGLINILE